MSKPIEEILPESRRLGSRIYAYSIDDDAHEGLLKVGQTTRDVKRASSSSSRPRAIKTTRSISTSSPSARTARVSPTMRCARAQGEGVRERVELEWMRCTADDVQTAITELRTGQQLTGTHHETFAMRREQAEAVNKTHAYFHSIWKEDMHAVPRFLWNAKMRFGKTFATYQLAKKLGATRCSW